MSQSRSGEQTLGLFSIDVLPGKSGVVAEAAFRPDGSVERLRFQAEQGDDRSEWSGWFDYSGEPIALRWEDFWT